MSLQEVSAWRSFGGWQKLYSHHSTATDTEMHFSIFLPPAATNGKVPLVTYLSGLTCNWENVTTKGGFQAKASELGLAVLCPDTSPRGLDLPGEHDAYDFGSGAGFYVDATEKPWSNHYQMERYISAELTDLVRRYFPVDMSRHGLFGHSMGGHGALTLALKHPQTFHSVSAFAPICSPMNCPWGEKALGGYLGHNRDHWRQADACALITDGKRVPDILVDQGLADQFLGGELKPELLERACVSAGIPLTLRRQPDYDHSYYFIASFMSDHLQWHSERLRSKD